MENVIRAVLSFIPILLTAATGLYLMAQHNVKTIWGGLVLISALLKLISFLFWDVFYVFFDLDYSVIIYYFTIFLSMISTILILASIIGLAQNKVSESNGIP